MRSSPGWMACSSPAAVIWTRSSSTASPTRASTASRQPGCHRDRAGLAGARPALPFLGICRGFQVMNVALGGTLYTHIQDQLPGALEHSHEKFREEHHFVSIDPDSLLECITGTNELAVNSLHHQGISRVAPALIPTACAPDGLVEGVELRAHPFGLGVQWHPEHLTDRGEMAALFKALVEAAGKFHDRSD